MKIGLRLKGLFETDGCFQKDPSNYTQYIELKNLCSRIKIDAYYKIIPSSKFFQRSELDDTRVVPIADVKAISGIKDIQVLLEFYSHSTAEGQDKVLAIMSL